MIPLDNAMTFASDLFSNATQIPGIRDGLEVLRMGLDSGT